MRFADMRSSSAGYLTKPARRLPKRTVGFRSDDDLLSTAPPERYGDVDVQNGSVVGQSSSHPTIIWKSGDTIPIGKSGDTIPIVYKIQSYFVIVSMNFANS